MTPSRDFIRAARRTAAAVGATFGLAAPAFADPIPPQSVIISGIQPSSGEMIEDHALDPTGRDLSVAIQANFLNVPDGDTRQVRVYLPQGSNLVTALAYPLPIDSSANPLVYDFGTANGGTVAFGVPVDLAQDSDEDATIIVEGVSIEAGTGLEASRSDQVTFTVDAESDGLDVLPAQDISGPVGLLRKIEPDVALRDLDGSEMYTARIDLGNAPTETGARVTNRGGQPVGTDLGNGMVEVTSYDIEKGVYLHTPINSQPAIFSLPVTYQGRDMPTDMELDIINNVSPSVTVTKAVVLGPPECGDGADNDGDGLTDMEDPGCLSSTWPMEQSDCDDGADNDGDGLSDYDDPGCRIHNEYHPGLPTENPICQDSVDNDGDGLADYPADPGCANEQQGLENPVCQDGMDNDGDGYTDYPADPGCKAPHSNVTEAPECDDGQDNDNDGVIDMSDADCRAAWDNAERPGACGLLGIEALFAIAAARVFGRGKKGAEGNTPAAAKSRHGTRLGL